MINYKALLISFRELLYGSQLIYIIRIQSKYKQLFKKFIFNWIYMHLLYHKSNLKSLSKMWMTTYLYPLQRL